MKTKLVISAILIIALYTLQSFSSEPEWLTFGNKKSSYIMGLDSNIIRNQKIMNSIKSKEELVDGFGSYVKEIKPGKYAGKLIRISGYVKVNDTSTIGGVWLMTDGTFEADSIRALKEGDAPMPSKEEKKDWYLSEFKIYIPVDATNIAYGVSLEGGGQIWFDDVSLEVVDETVESNHMH